MPAYHWNGVFLTLFLVEFVGLPFAAVILVGGYILSHYKVPHRR